MATAHPPHRDQDAPPASKRPVTAFTFARLLNPDDRADTLELTREGHLVVTVRGEILARIDSLLLGSQNLEPRPVHRRMQGREISEVFQRLVCLEGEGHMVLGCDGERYFLLELRRDLCFFAERYLWAVECSLMWDVGVLPGSRPHEPIALVRLAGAGSLALRVPGDLVAIKIALHRPYRVRRERFVGWVGSVVPRLQDPDFLHCEGEGAVLVTLPGSGRGTGAEVCA